MPDPSIHRFRQMTAVALAHLEERRQEINDLNVCPVADGDTCDNMALTMRYVLDGLDRLEAEEKDPSRPEIVRAVARAALMGARGNSGVILSQFIRGAAEKLVTPPGRLIDPEIVKEGLSAASEAANASVRDPQPGTMLTVAERMAAAVEERLDHWREHHKLDEEATEEEQNALLAEMMTTALFAGEEAVRHTPEQLEVLAEHGVVDAGALGLVVLVRGYVAGLAGEQVSLPEIPHYAPARSHDVHHADPTFRWCTNFIVTGEGLDADEWVPKLDGLGDSVLVVGDPATIKVHVHTDDFEAAKALFDGAGEIVQEDIADMRKQVAAREAKLRGGRSVAVAVATGNGMREMFESLGAFVVDGGATLNPSTADLLSGIERAPAEEIVLFPNSPNVRMAANEAAEIAEKTVVVIPCDSQQAALAALPEADTQAGAGENGRRLGEALGRIRAGGVAPAVKDDIHGRFSKDDAVGFVGDEIVAWGGTGTTLRQTLEILGKGAELVTIFAADDAPIPADELGDALDGGAEVDVQRAGQPGWWWLITAE
ncbi:MAG: DAK2 domain-containing protein [Solirubrobacterales bacterium]